MKPPVEVAHLFSIIDAMLIELLQSLSQAEWQLPTLAKKWTVKDVAAHLLDGNMRTISAKQGFSVPPPGANTSLQELINYLDEMNASWVNAMKRVSPALIIQLLESTGKQFSAIMEAEPLFEQARFGVAWAGEETSMNWFHIAREYTEKIHHQLQVRHAVNREAELMSRPLFYPFLDTLMYGLPHAMRSTPANENTVAAITVNTNAGGSWFVIMQDGEWKLCKENKAQPKAHVTIAPELAWKVFTKGITALEAGRHCRLEGDRQLCNALLKMVAVMA